MNGHVTPPSRARTLTRGVTPTPRLPLYLCDPMPTQVDTDGPAFLVRREDKAPARYPFNRVARIIAGRSVAWTTGAITACLDQDIPVVFLDRARAPAGYLQSRLRQPSHLDAAITELLDRPDGVEHYTQWLRAQRMCTLKDWRRTTVAGRHLTENAFRRLVQRYVYQLQDPSPEFVAAELYRSAVFAYALHPMKRWGVKPFYWGHNAHPIHLANDLAAMLLLRLNLEMHPLDRSFHGSDADLLTLLHRFEAVLWTQATVALGRLNKHVCEILELWP